MRRISIALSLTLCMAACEAPPRPGTMAEGVTDAQSICLILFSYVEQGCPETVTPAEDMQ